MARKFYIAYVSLTAAALLAGIVGFTAFFHSQAHAQSGVSTASMRCFVGNKMDRPSTHMTRGWVCVSEQIPAAIN
jgi:hypothetical protein